METLSPALPVIAAFMVGVCVWVAVGRLLFRTVNPPDIFPAFPSSLLAGMGVWAMVWVGVVGLGGGDTVVAAPVFVVLMMMLAGNHLRHWARYRKGDEHFFSLAVMHGLLLLPWAVPLLLAQPAGLDMLDSLLGINYWHGLGRWPTPEQAMLVDGTYLPLGWLATLLGAGVMLAQVTPVLTGLLNVMLVVVGAGLLAAVTRAPLRWSNMLLMAAGSLAIMLLLNPVWVPSMLLSAVPPWAAPVVLAALALPLVAGRPLPVGWAALPYGFIAAWLALLHPFGVYAAVVVAGVWLVKGSTEQGPTPPVLMAASWLSCLPVCVWAAQYHLILPWQAQGCELTTAAGLISCLTAQTHAPLLAWWQAPVLVMVAALSLLATAGLPKAERPAAITVLTLVALLAAPALVVPGWLPGLLHLGGMVLLFPLIRLWMHLYLASHLKDYAFRWPWLCGLLLLAPLLAAVMAYVPAFRTLDIPMLHHAAQVAEDMREKGISSHQPLATIGLPQIATVALAYYLNNPAVRAEIEAPRLYEMHRRLRNSGYGWAWVGPGRAARLLGFSRVVEATLLFETTPDAMVIRGVYPLPIGLEQAAETR